MKATSNLARMREMEAEADSNTEVADDEGAGLVNIASAEPQGTNSEHGRPH